MEGPVGFTSVTSRTGSSPPFLRPRPRNVARPRPPPLSLACWRRIVGACWLADAGLLEPVASKVSTTGLGSTSSLSAPELMVIPS